jgi:hypothetical protein
MAKYLSASDFLKGIIGEEEDFDVPGLGTIRIRPLGMGEAMRINDKATDDAERFVLMLTKAIVEPALDETQCADLYKASGDVLQPLLSRISALAGNGGADADPLVGGGS